MTGATGRSIEPHGCTNLVQPVGQAGVAQQPGEVRHHSQLRTTVVQFFVEFCIDFHMADCRLMVMLWT